MAREHHCPNCGPQACNASTSKIHTCGVCAAIWEEDLSAPAAAPPSPKPATTPTAPAPSAPGAAKPAAPPNLPAKPASPPAAPPAESGPAAKPPAPSPAPPVAPAPSRAPITSAPPLTVSPPPPKTPVTTAAAPPASAPKPVPLLAPGAVKTLAEALQGATVKRCPSCQSDGVSQPSEFSFVQGRLVLSDSQTYRGHRWYADTGEILPAAGSPPSPAAPKAPTAVTHPTAGT